MNFRAMLPAPLRRQAKRMRNAIVGVDHNYRNCDTQTAFEKIYSEGVWGKDRSGNAQSGSGSHNAAIVQPYVTSVTKFLSSLEEPRVVDLGCGDFSVGSQFVSLCSNYLACDISTFILDQNRRRFQETNLEFRHLNLASDELPEGDVAFVRQVLQHLGNSDIQAFVQKLNRVRPFKHLIVTESLPEVEFSPNLDKPAGPNTRLGLKSGVDLDVPPFDLEFAEKRILVDVPDETPTGERVIIRSFLYTLR